MVMSDGYQDTQVTVTISLQTVTVKAKAPLDNGFNDIGLQIDKNDVIKMDKVVEERSALFAASYSTILEQIAKGPALVKKGRKPTISTLKLYMRFWPTWPTKGLQTLDVSLEGFSKAYTELKTCK
jgi:hypothetical protein